MGDFTLKNIKEVLAGETRIKVTFNLNIDGILTVCALKLIDSRNSFEKSCRLDKKRTLAGDTRLISEKKDEMLRKLNEMLDWIKSAKSTNEIENEAQKLNDYFIAINQKQTIQNDYDKANNSLMNADQIENIVIL